MRTGYTSTSVKVGVFLIANTLCMATWFIPSLWGVNYVIDALNSDDRRTLRTDFWDTDSLLIAFGVDVVITIVLWLGAWAVISLIDPDKP